MPGSLRSCWVLLTSSLLAHFVTCRESVEAWQQCEIFLVRQALMPNPLRLHLLAQVWSAIIRYFKISNAKPFSSLFTISSNSQMQNLCVISLKPHCKISHSLSVTAVGSTTSACMLQCPVSSDVHLDLHFILLFYQAAGLCIPQLTVLSSTRNM